MVELPKFGHMTTSTNFDTSDKILLVTSWTEIMTSWPLFQNTFVLRRPRVDKFADIKIAAIFIKTTLKDSIEVKKISHALKCSLYLYFLI